MDLYMASRPEENLYCPVCHEIFQDPVILACSHSFCRACLQKWWTDKTVLECPVCMTPSSVYDAPQNLALKNLCEDWRLERLWKRSEALCSLHSENLRLFCLDHQQLLCVICLHSETHKNHTIRPIEEAARDCKERLRELLEPLQEKLKDTRGNFDQTAQDIEVQAQDTKRQIKDVFLMLQKFLQEEEEARIGAVTEERNQKSEMMKTESEASSREMSALSDTVRATEEVLQAEDLSFLQKYKTTAETVQCFPLNDPDPIPRAHIDTTKHLNDLSFKILDSLKDKITPTRPPPPDHKPQLSPKPPSAENDDLSFRETPAVVSLRDNLSSLNVRARRSLYETISSSSSQSEAVSMTQDPRRRSVSVFPFNHQPKYARVIPPSKSYRGQDPFGSQGKITQPKQQERPQPLPTHLATTTLFTRPRPQVNYYATTPHTRR